jgi:hypothetical protein
MHASAAAAGRRTLACSWSTLLKLESCSLAPPPHQQQATASRQQAQQQQQQPAASHSAA